MDEMEVTLNTKANRFDLDLAIKTLETDLESNATRVRVLDTYLTDNVVRIGVLKNDLDSNATRISVLDTDLTDNMVRIGVLETDLESNATRIGVLDTDLISNASRICVVETNLTSNTSRIETLETDLTSNSYRVVSLETTDASRGTSIQGLYDADYAPKSWVNDKDYATESYVNGAVASASAVGLLIDAAVASRATSQSVTDLSDVVNTKVPVPSDWTALSSPDGLKTYVETKVGSDVVRTPADWLAYPDDPPNFGSSNLKVYAEGKVNNFKDGNSSYMKLRDASVNASGLRTGTQKLVSFTNHSSQSVRC
jgi:hypothetical protein